ncbi:MAG: bifunctional glutamate N-acetyltransferase/amino-acid acetyltransferase ArgJ [Actinomycetota bacterium]|nr:bifunctional glutamate N-acetyltransferase/amino-acid acetyltransferase ArgJ [Actinomycetota bacterium]
MRWPGGVRSAGVHAGIKPDGAPDLGIIVTDEPVVWAGTFTRNAAAAACVEWCRAAGEEARVIVVNSGNANACTGPVGVATVDATVDATAHLLGCEREQVLVASTGPIGIQLDPARLVAAVPAALQRLTPDPTPFARAIVTTDTRTKVASYSDGCTVVGVAKGAAMVAPGMATMLGFVVTDAVVDRSTLVDMVRTAVDASFNRISIDACESTNDAVFVLSTARRRVAESTVAAGLSSVCRDLAQAIARDAEGATKLVRIYVTGARDDAHAALLGRAVAASSLWRAALHGADPNWGRVLAALGSADRRLQIGACRIALGPEVVFDGGAPAGSLDAAAKAMAGDEVSVHCAVGDGPGEAEVLTSDLSPAYVTLNAEGTS